MSGLVACNNEEDPIKNEGTGMVTTFLPLYKSMVIFPYAEGQLTQSSCSDPAKL